MKSKARPRILLVLDDERDLSGPSIVLLRLFSALQERGLAEIHVITQRSAKILAVLEANGLAHTLHDYPITYSRENLALVGRRSPIRDAKRRLILAVAKDFEADLVHLAVHPLGPLVAWALAETGVPCFVHFHANHAFPRFSPYSLVYRRCLSHPNVHAIAVSNWIKDNIVKMGVPAEKISRIYNGLSHNKFTPTGGQNQLARPVVAFIAQIRPEKGLLHFIQALRLAAGKLPRDESHTLTGAIIGQSFDPSYLETCKSLATKCENESGGRLVFDFLGWSPEPFNIFDTMDAVVLPSLFDDPLPTVAVESVCRGLPTIGYARGGLLEILGKGRGCLVPADDIPAMAEAIHDAIASKDWKKREMVHLSAISVFSMDTMIETYLSLVQYFLRFQQRRQDG